MKTMRKRNENKSKKMGNHYCIIHTQYAIMNCMVCNATFFDNDETLFQGDAGYVVPFIVSKNCIFLSGLSGWHVLKKPWASV